MKSRFLLILSILCVLGCEVGPNGIGLRLPKHNPKKVIVNPDKITTHDLRVLVIQDRKNEASLPLAQLSMLTSTELRKQLKENCAKDSDGNPQFRFVDKSDKLTPFWSDMLGTEPDSYPWIVLKNGSNTASVPLPKAWDDLTKLLNHYAGVEQ